MLNFKVFAMEITQTEKVEAICKSGVGKHMGLSSS